MVRTTTDDPRSDSMKIDMAEHFDDFEYEYREDGDTHATVVHEDDEVTIVADHTRHELNEWASEYDVDRDALSKFFHDVAKRRTDLTWGVSDPIVFDTFADDGL